MNEVLEKNFLFLWRMDESRDIFAIQQLLCPNDFHGKSEKSMYHEFNVIHTFDESGFYFNPSLKKMQTYPNNSEQSTRN